MRKSSAVGLAAGLVAVLFVGVPGFALAQSRPVIDFNIVAPTDGSISYAGGSAPLIGTGLDVDSITGNNTPLHDGVTLRCISCVLTFTTGGFLRSTLGGWVFGPGGSVMIVGGVDLDGNGTIGPGDIPTGTTLLSGSFTGETTVSIIGYGTFRISAGSFRDHKNNALTAFFGLSSDIDYDGGLNLSFSSSGRPPGPFVCAELFSGLLFNTGEPPGMTPTPRLVHPTNTKTRTPTHTRGPATDTPTHKPTRTFTPTKTRTPSKTRTASRTPTSTPSNTPGTGEPTNTPAAATLTPTATATQTFTASSTATSTRTATDTATPTQTDTATETPTNTAVPSDTPTMGPTLTATPDVTSTPTGTSTATSTLPPVAECPNGVVEQGEECDDGNLFSGDGCEPNCLISMECNYVRAEPPDEVFVNDDTAPGLTPDCATPDFSTIQAAVDAVSDGDIINICAGTYGETVIVTKEVTLRGTDGAFATTVQAASGITLDLRRSATRIESLTVISTNGQAIAANQICPLGEPTCATPGVRGSNIVIDTSVIKNSATGVDWRGKVDCVDIEDSTFADNGKHIVLDHSIASFGPAILVRIRRNDVDRGGMVGMPGMTVRGNEALIEDNEVRDATEDALCVGTAALFVRRNLFQDSGASGIVVKADGITCSRVPPGGAPRNCLQITENNIYRNTVDGIRVEAGTQTVDTGIHCNNFENNGVGLGNEATSGELDATGNWWGSDTGPSGVYPGMGDRIENRAGATTLFIEFLCAPCPQGFPSVNGSCDMNPEIRGFIGHDPDVDPVGRSVAFVSDQKNLDNDPRTTAPAFNNSNGFEQVFLLTRKWPVTFGADGTCIGGERAGEKCLTLLDCPPDPGTYPSGLNGDCVLFTQITPNIDPDGSCFKPRLAFRAGNLLFETPDDLLGLNPDGSMEVYRWNKRIFQRESGQPLSMLTNGGVGKGSLYADLHLRAAVVESRFSPPGASNADGNLEIFLFDTRRDQWSQLTNTMFPVENRRPVDRRGRKVLFDSNGDLDNDKRTDYNNADGNRELFLVKRGRRAMIYTQLTNSTFPVENRAGGLGFHNQVAAFSSTGNYTQQNPDGNWEIFTVFKGAFAQVTISNSGESVDPVMNYRGRLIAFVSTADLMGDGASNRRIFLFDRNSNTLTQLSRSSVGDNQNPRISNGRFIVWDSDVDLTKSPAQLRGGVCDGGPNDKMACIPDSDCPGGSCNRQRLVYLFDRLEDD